MFSNRQCVSLLKIMCPLVPIDIHPQIKDLRITCKPWWTGCLQEWLPCWYFYVGLVILRLSGAFKVVSEVPAGRWGTVRESRGWHRGARGSHMAADKERGQSWQGRGNGDGRREGKGGNHTGRTTCSPSAKAESSSSNSGLYVCMLVCVPLTDNTADWIQHGGLCPDSTDAISLDRPWSVWVTESHRKNDGGKECVFLSLCVIHMCVCVVQRGCQPSSQPTSQPESSACLRSLCTSWVSQVLSCPLTPPGPPITAGPQARSVNCHLLPDQYYLTLRTTCHSTSEGSDSPRC